jgi:16S rRNA (guanine(966)-N(2))-methyltransferase RsmD
VVNSNFLDLFAGTGGVGIEALSRGAQQAVFVEQANSNVVIIKKNLRATGLAAKARCLALSVEKAIPLLSTERSGFELVYLDPPYAKNLAPAVLRSLVANALLVPKVNVVVESGKQELPPEYGAANLRLYRQEKYGDTVLSFYQFQ